MTVYLKLAGTNTKGLNPKGCYTSGWTDPFYQGTSLTGAALPDRWTGMRLDNHIVVDCDDEQAKDAWLAHIDLPLSHTWVRKTPNGYHFIYKRGVNSYGIKAKVPWFLPKVDLKVGPGHLVVMWAPGYEDLEGGPGLESPFSLDWCPTVIENDKPIEEWDEVPEGMGDSTMISIAGKMRSLGMSEEKIRGCLSAINDVVMTEKPMRYKDIMRLARSAARYEPDERQTIECPSCQAELEVR